MYIATVHLIHTVLYSNILLITILLYAPLMIAAQPAGNELPLPNIKGASMVIKVRQSFMQPRPYQDTEAVFLIGPDGYARTLYLGAPGNCTGKVQYAYRDGQLIRRMQFNTLDRHMLFTSPNQHSHREVSENTWVYQQGKVTLTRHIVGASKTKTRVCRYTYDSRGRIAGEYNDYPAQTLLYYPTRYDSVLYRYMGDSVYQLAYEQGMLRDSFAYVERHNSAGLVIETHQISRDGKHFEREIKHYDSSGRITVYESFSDRPAVQDDGKVLRADRVEYSYDAQGRPDEIICSALGIRRWSWKYDYLR